MDDMSPALAGDARETGNFVRFPTATRILQELRAIPSYTPDFDPLFRIVAERLEHKAYDRSAFVFILIELIYEVEEASGRSLSDLLSQSVFALTEDADLAGSARDTFLEIKETIEPEAEAAGMRDAPKQQQAGGAGAARAEQERLMSELQRAQKRITDSGLSTRMAIEMTLGRPGRDSVRATLEQIASLRATLRRFEELLSESERQILEAIGVLEKH